jgi:hypothetical protein
MSQYHYDRMYDESIEFHDDEEEEADNSEYLFMLQKRVQCAIERYAGIEEYMEPPNIDIWLNLKSEIIHHYYSHNYVVEEEDIDHYYDDYDDERRCNSFIDRILCKR